MRILALSFICMISTQLVPGQGVIAFGNRIVAAGIDAPVFDVDCQTRLAGEAYLGQAYVGLTPESVQPLGQIFAFPSPGYIPIHSVTIPGVFNDLVYTQLRAWESAAGPTYEAAVAAGGKHGFSNIVPMLAVTGPGAPFYPVGLESFCLVPEPPGWVLGLLGMAGACLGLRPRRLRSCSKVQQVGPVW